MSSAESLDGLSCAALREQLKKNRLSTAGKKTELKKRLSSFLLGGIDTMSVPRGVTLGGIGIDSEESERKTDLADSSADDKSEKSKKKKKRSGKKTKAAEAVAVDEEDEMEMAEPFPRGRSRTRSATVDPPTSPPRRERRKRSQSRLNETFSDDDLKEATPASRRKRSQSRLNETFSEDDIKNPTPTSTGPRSRLSIRRSIIRKLDLDFDAEDVPEEPISVQKEKRKSGKKMEVPEEQMENEEKPRTPVTASKSRTGKSPAHTPSQTGTPSGVVKKRTPSSFSFSAKRFGGAAPASASATPTRKTPQKKASLAPSDAALMSDDGEDADLLSDDGEAMEAEVPQFPPAAQPATPITFSSAARVAAKTPLTARKSLSKRRSIAGKIAMSGPRTIGKTPKTPQSVGRQVGRFAAAHAKQLSMGKTIGEAEEDKKARLDQVNRGLGEVFKRLATPKGAASVPRRPQERSASKKKEKKLDVAQSSGFRFDAAPADSNTLTFSFGQADGFAAAAAEKREEGKEDRVLGRSTKTNIPRHKGARLDAKELSRKRGGLLAPTASSLLKKKEKTPVRGCTLVDDSSFVRRLATPKGRVAPAMKEERRGYTPKTGKVDKFVDTRLLSDSEFASLKQHGHVKQTQGLKRQNKRAVEAEERREQQRLDKIAARRRLNVE